MSERFVVLSGCSGGGKSTLLTELRRRGYAGVDEPGRRIVLDELAQGGSALPWIDPQAFAQRAIEVSLADRNAARDQTGWVFFDRGLIDAASALSETALASLGPAHPYHQTVFLTPPWPEIFVTDPERRHDLDAAIAEYERLVLAYPSLGYRVVILPRTTVQERADLVLETIQT